MLFRVPWSVLQEAGLRQEPTCRCSLTKSSLAVAPAACLRCTACKNRDSDDRILWIHYKIYRIHLSNTDRQLSGCQQVPVHESIYHKHSTFLVHEIKVRAQLFICLMMESFHSLHTDVLESAHLIELILINS